MIVVKLLGGFGNQLFQYGAGRALSIKRNEELQLDLSFLNAEPKGAYTKRNYELDQINSISKFVSKEDLKLFDSKTIFKKISNRLGFSSYRVFNEFQANYISAFEKLPKNVLLNGYWQSEKYFLNIKEQLLNEITPNYEFTLKGKFYHYEISKSKAVSIHVRRGDYLNMPSAIDFHGTCSMDYYKSAIIKLDEKFNDLKYFIFSDDINWCKSEFNFLKSPIFIEEEPEKKSSQDLFLMSYCKHNIIANSSYSWWAAWLNKSHSKLVIAPKKWFANKLNDSDICPETWIRL